MHSVNALALPLPQLALGSFVHKTDLFCDMHHPLVERPGIQADPMHIRVFEQIVGPKPEGLCADSTTQVLVFADVDSNVPFIWAALWAVAVDPPQRLAFLCGDYGVGPGKRCISFE